MWKSGTFDLSDINEELIKEIVFLEVTYGAIGEPGYVVFFTERGDEYVISQNGTSWILDDIVQKFSEIYEAYKNDEGNVIDEYGFKNIRNWVKIPIFSGRLLVRKDYFERFYDRYKMANKIEKQIPLDIVRNVVGREAGASDKRMVYVKTQESWDMQRQLREMKEKERIENRLSEEEVPWLEYNDCIGIKGAIRFWIRRNDDDTYSAYRWCVQEQKEQLEEGCVNITGAVECYNLFLLESDEFNIEIIENFEQLYRSFIMNNKFGKFVRSYKTIEQAKEAASIRNEWIGWGNVDKKNVYMIDYEQLKDYITNDKEILFF